MLSLTSDSILYSNKFQLDITRFERGWRALALISAKRASCSQGCGADWALWHVTGRNVLQASYAYQVPRMYVPPVLLY